MKYQIGEIVNIKPGTDAIQDFTYRTKNLEIKEVRHIYMIQEENEGSLRGVYESDLEKRLKK